MHETRLRTFYKLGTKSHKTSIELCIMSLNNSAHAEF